MHPHKIFRWKIQALRQTMRWGFVVWGMLTIFLSSAHADWHINVLWDRSGAGDSSGYGTNVFRLGDQNDDGYADWAVVAWGTRAGSPSEPKVEFFHGGHSPDILPYQVVAANSATELDVYGSPAGNVNGDSYQDWIIARRYRAAPSVYQIEIYHGGPGGGVQPAVTLHVPLEGGIHSAGDINRDGFSDICMDQAASGHGEILFGGNPMDTIPDWCIDGAAGYHVPSIPVAFGDLNGDGYSDIVSLPSLSLDQLFIFFGGTHPDTIPAVIWDSFTDWPIAVVNDLNGDGIAELITVANGTDLNVHLGGPNIAQTPAYVLSFPLCDAGPSSIQGAGDVNRDGYGDLLVVDPYCNMGWGKLALYAGNYQLSPDPVLVIDGRSGPLNLIGIWTAVGLGDVNGDSINDFAIGATNDDADGERGRVVILSGDTTVHVAADPRHIPQSSSFSLSVYPNPFNSSTRIAFTVPRTGEVGVRVYDVTGRVVKTLVDKTMEAGEQEVMLDGAGMASGVYLVRVKAGEEVRVGKVMLLK